MHLLPQTAAPLHAGVNTALNPAELLTPEQAAQALGLSAKTLATWRSTGRHALAFIRCGARIRYRRSDLLAWLEQRTHSSTPDAVKGAA